MSSYSLVIINYSYMRNDSGLYSWLKTLSKRLKPWPGFGLSYRGKCVKVCATPDCSRRIWFLSQMTCSVSTAKRAATQRKYALKKIESC